MSDGDALLAAILANSAEDTPRLEYADWLQEQGQDERAEFIRVQCEAHRLNDHEHRPHPNGLLPNCAQCSRLQELWDRERELLAAAPRDWLGVLADLPRLDGVVDPCVFRRGFVESVTCTAQDWVRHADAILAQQPVSRVTLTTRPRLRATIETGAHYTYLSVVAGKEIRVTLDEVDREADHDGPRIAFERRWKGVKFTLPDPNLLQRYEECDYVRR